ncbi:Major Facilitator Superfamily protein [Micromonospora citrea]|uniref:Major Facilitator Superfamily protein n=1 Tax=Micromonospora citrea TaxID=47855 RepID=A0A1C6VTS7_9ACTN|nr:MFS transporter [Micromonospora citrea]SCL69695.1 Major Facilitator Superfamily protein [Micromonospora citrea]
MGADVAERGRGGAVLVAALTVDSVGNGLFLPLSLVYFLRLTDVPLSLLGVLLSAATVLTLPVPLWAGALADRVGALPVVVAAQLLQAAGYLAYAWVRGPVGVFVAAALVAVGVRFFWSTVFTAVADYADSSPGAWTRDTWYAVSNGARTAGLAAGGLVTGVVVADGRAGTYRAVAYAAAACFALAAVLIAACVRTPAATDRPVALRRGGYATLARDRPFLALTGLNTVFALSSMMLGLALPTVMLTDVRGPAWLTSTVLAGNAFLVALLSASVGTRLPRHRRTRAIAAAAVLWAAWGLAMATVGPGRLATVAVLLAAATLLFTAAELVHAPASAALAAAAAPVAARGRYLAAFQYSFAVASLVAPAFFATLYEAHDAAPWLALALLNAAGAAGVLALERHLPPAALREPSRAAPARADADAPTR